METLSLSTVLLRKLSAAVNGHAATATFACGGSVPIIDEATAIREPGKLAVSPPVTLRWDAAMDTKASITFPPSQEEPHFGERLSALVQACQPATFGIGGRDVLDEGYRKAGKLDTSQFSSNFHPHDCGIVDTVQQVLLPSTVRGGLELGFGPQGIKAELYKLNIYSAPSGRFRPHVDTPRGPTQFGSLVVCLPCQHEGGTLRVKHRGQVTDFNWAQSSPHSIQWAAFYGDCEHEVFEVTGGHRVTLTYNLYYSWTGSLDHGVYTPDQLPLYRIVRDMVAEPSSMEKGGILGFFCHHQYAHAHESGRKSIPHAFKGVDLAVYSVFRSLGLKIGVHPIIENNDHDMGGMSKSNLMHIDHDVEVFLQELEECTPEEWEDKSDEYNEDEEIHTTNVGTAMHSPKFSVDIDECSRDTVTDEWPHKKVRQIMWMNNPSHHDFACAGLAYGNQAELHYKFSAAAILVVIPPTSDRISPHMVGGALDFDSPPLELKSTHGVCPKCVAPRRVKHDMIYYCAEHLTPYEASWQMKTDDRIHCIVEGCDVSVSRDYQPDDIKLHYLNTHMYGPRQLEGKQRTWLSVERAQELGLGELDPRVRGRWAPRGGGGSQPGLARDGGGNEVVCLDSEGEESQETSF